jgi:hypothetical protein
MTPKLHFPPERSDDLMLLVREFGHNILIKRLVLQRDFPRREGDSTNYCNNSTGVPEAQQSKLNSGLLAMDLPMRNAADP